MNDVVFDVDLRGDVEQLLVRLLAVVFFFSLHPICRLLMKRSPSPLILIIK